MQMTALGINWAKNVLQGASESAAGDLDRHGGTCASMFMKTVRSIGISTQTI
jgi:hypothetical protein